MFRSSLKYCTLLLTLFAAYAQIPGPAQPIPFSHKLHAEAKLTCSTCHSDPQKFGDSIEIPDAPKCLECHAWSQNPTPTRATLLSYVEKKQAIPWVRVFSLRDFVFFDHRYHLMNGAECEGCHGPISTEDVVADQLNTTKMTFCQPCHVKTRALTGCTTCHNQR